ncbi:MAG: glycosyltransferase [Betaproteobacteria bacterium]|nr:glycosyltransferase [Betaproteobacteria bacterium]NDE53245.1 glycosyltransferase [Actinomycetota bacterium]
MPWPSVAYCAFAPSFMDVRLEQPIAAMREAGAQVYSYEKKIVVPQGVDIVVIQRMIANKRQWQGLVQEVEARSALLVTEWDDHPEKFPPSIRARFGSEPLLHVLSGHAIQTSTATLRAHFEQHHPEVIHFPNQLRSLPASVKRSGESVQIFFGALNREEDWLGLVAGINRALARHPALKAIVVHDRQFFDQLETSNKVYFPAQPYERYIQLMQASDLVLMPLADCIENHCKSDIKFVEAAAGAATVIASPVVYGNTIQHRQTGWIAKDAGEWFEAIDTLAERPELRLAIGEAARAYVARERMLSNHITARLSWYRDLVLRRSALFDWRRKRDQ